MAEYESGYDEISRVEACWNTSTVPLRVFEGYEKRTQCLGVLLGHPFTYLITYLLTELSPSRGAANCAAPQELPSILWNPKVKKMWIYTSTPVYAFMT
jgi:hypothetical protein